MRRALFALFLLLSLFTACSKPSLNIESDDLFSLYKPLSSQSAPQTVNLIWDKENLSFSCQNEPLEPLVNRIIKEQKKGVSYVGRLYGTVTIQANHEHYLAVLSRILESNGYTLDSSQALFSIKKSAPDGTITRKISLFDLDANSLCTKLKESYDSDIKITLVSEHNAIILTGEGKEITELEETIGLLDHPVPSILLEIVLVEINQDKMADFGISLSELGNKRFFINSYNSGGDIDNNNFNGIELKDANSMDLPSGLIFKANLKALQKKGLAKILTHPHVVSRSGEQAVIEISLDNYLYLQKQSDENQKFYIDVEKVSTGVSLQMVPVLTQSGQILINLKAEESIVLPPENNANFVVDRNTLQSTFRARDGEVIAAGGLFQKIDIHENSGLPLLQSIPVLNLLFARTSRQKSRQEVVFFILPRIFNHQYQNISAPTSDKTQYQ